MTDHTNIPFTAEQPQFKKLRNSQAKLTQIQKDLEILVDSMAQNPSILSRATRFWGNRPLWQKIVAGVVLSAPVLLFSLFIHLAICIGITALIAAAYAGASVILDDHFNHTQHSTKNIKSGVTSLAEGLDVVTNSLELISEALAEQVSQFTMENERLGDNISDLHTRNEVLTQEIDKLRDTEKKLKLNQCELEKTCSELKQSVTNQSALLEDAQTTLNKVTIDYQENQKQLQEKTNDLDKLQKQYASEIDQYKLLLETLQITIENLTETIELDEDRQKAFHQKLTQFIDQKDSSFLAVFERICRAEKELVQVKEQLKQATAQYETHVKRLTNQVDRLEQVQPDKQSTGWGNLGFYANQRLVDPTKPTSSPNYTM